MKRKNIILSIVVTLSTALVLSACNGGGGTTVVVGGGGGGGTGGGGTGGGGTGGGTGGGGCTYNCYPTHEQLAYEFINRVNSEIIGFDLELVKINTLQQDYIVVYDWDYASYDAYYIGSYLQGDDMAWYINSYEDWFYYDLIPDSGNTYWDPITGVLFDKQVASGKNLAKMKALKEHLTINKVAEKLQANYGLSAEKSLDVARFTYKLQSAQPGTYNKADYDAFAKELTGSSISEFKSDFEHGNIKSLQDRIHKAAEETGMGPEGVNKFINDMFVEN